MKENDFNAADVKDLYWAFISLCDFIENDEAIGCGKCPLWNQICENKDKPEAKQFAESLYRIRMCLSKDRGPSD